jgi:D-proline reductase (dithiol) PrdB
MCHQTVSLVQVELERRGIVTASLSVMLEVTRRLGPPRALVVDRPLGAVMGAPHDGAGQTAVLERLLALTARSDVPAIEIDGPAATSPG